MLAAIYKGIGEIEIEEIEKPTINEDEYLLKIYACGLCGTDIKTFKQGHRLFTPPTILGHEFSGEIVEAGSNMDQSLIGKFVTAAPYVGCDECQNCLNDLEELCTNKSGTGGSFTEYLVIPKKVADKTLHVFDNPEMIHSMALSEPLACILNSIRKSEIKENQSVLIIGGGPMGLLHVAALQRYNLEHLLLTEFHDKRREAAQQMGAQTIDPQTEDVKERINTLTNSQGVDHIIVCVGLPEVVEEAFDFARAGTTINIFGGLKSGSTITIDPNIIHYSEVKVVGAFGFSSDDFNNAAHLLANGEIKLDQIITNTYPLEDILEAFKNSTNPETVKTVVQIVE